jgi:hypothetical protein
MVDIHIDRLTNSIVKRATGEVFETDVLEVVTEDLLNLSNWNFDWLKESHFHTIYKLVTEVEPQVIQGLLSLSPQKDHVWLSLVENAPLNLGRNGVYEGVAGNLFAFACRHSVELGLDGFVAFEAKSALVKHYQNTLRAKIIVGNRMYLDNLAAQFLIEKYYSK